MLGNFSSSQGLSSLSMERSHRYMLMEIFPSEALPLSFSLLHPANSTAAMTSTSNRLISRFVFIYSVLVTILNGIN